MFKYLKKIFIYKSKKFQNQDPERFPILEEVTGVSSRDVDWVEETFINYSDEELSRTDKNYLGLTLNNSKFIIFFICILIGVFLLFTRAAYLQVVMGTHYLNVAEQNRLRIYNLPAPRGIIYDVNGNQLVQNVPTFAIFLIPNDFPQSEQEMQELQTWLKNNLHEYEIDEKLEKILNIKPNEKEFYEPVLLVDNIDYEKAIQLKVDSSSLRSVLVDVLARREYVNTYKDLEVKSLAHILGYQGKVNENEYQELKNKGYLFNDSIGKTGLEKVYEKQLRGVYGKEKIEIDATGKAIKIVSKEEVEKGDNLYLTIDLIMQAKLEEIIQNYLEKYNKKKAAAVVLDPQSGKIRSLISLPGFNSNLFAEGISSEDYQSLINDENQPLFNRTVSGEYPSGSTVKMVMGAAALEEGIVNERTSFLSVGGIRIGQWFFPDWRAGGHGYTDIRKAIADSVNTFFYIIGGGYGDREGLGVERIKEYCERFGLNQLTGIDLPNEKPGFLPSPEWKEEKKGEKWYIGDTYHLVIGQGDILVTPLQVANYTAVFANKGILYKPTLLDKYFVQSKNEIINNQPEVLKSEFVDPYNLTLIRQGLRQAVTKGSARILNSLPVTAGAKTGTAQWKQDAEPHSWFTAFTPYENTELVVTVLVEEGGDGSFLAANITNDFLNWYYRVYKK